MLLSYSSLQYFFAIYLLCINKLWFTGRACLKSSILSAHLRRRCGPPQSLCSPSSARTPPWMPRWPPAKCPCSQTERRWRRRRWKWTGELDLRAPKSPVNLELNRRVFWQKDYTIWCMCSSRHGHKRVCVNRGLLGRFELRTGGFLEICHSSFVKFYHFFFFFSLIIYLTDSFTFVVWVCVSACFWLIAKRDWFVLVCLNILQTGPSRGPLRARYGTRRQRDRGGRRSSLEKTRKRRRRRRRMTMRVKKSPVPE